MAAVADHMGDQLGSIAYFDAFTADLCVLGELTDNQVCLGHRGRYYFDVTDARALRPHLPQAAGDQRERPRGAGGPGARRLEVRAGAGPVDRRSVRSRDLRGPRPHLRGSSPRGAVDDPRRVRDPRRLPPTAGRDDRTGAGRDRPVPGGGGEGRSAFPGRGRARRREVRVHGGSGRRGRPADADRGPRGARGGAAARSSRTGWATRRASERRCRR